MNTNPLVPLKDQKEKPTILSEVADLDKKLWTLILTKGLMHLDVQDLYKKVCCSYEQFILTDRELPDLQDVEYSLWKLHYKHIDEFRKRAQLSANEEIKRSQNGPPRCTDNYVEGFKSFLSEATEFYHQLMIKTNKYYGFPESVSCFRNDNATFGSVEPKNMQKLQFLRHRFLVCLGDLARYKEQCQETSSQNWSAAVNYYLEATRVWPDSGTPHNQMAVLAIYVGDDILALYHCIRSLAIKEPFPDAWNNLILLFERNSSSHIHAFSRDVSFDFLRPSERTRSNKSISSYCQTENDDQEGPKETELWALVIRLMGFFFLTSSVEDFSCTFACMMKELDILLTLDDGKLKGACESYQLMDSGRSGPFRILQVVCIFIFVIGNQLHSPEAKKDIKIRSNEQQLVWTKLALAAAFIFMGRLVDRCLKASLLDSCPLLPALLVYTEWLVGILPKADTYGTDERVKSSMSYFFQALVELLNRIGSDRAKFIASGNVALWEDFDLRGFAPIFRSHASLVYSAGEGHVESSESGSEWRFDRMVKAAMLISDISNHKWIRFSYDKCEKKFYISESGSKKVGLIGEVKEIHPHGHEVREECDELILEELTREPGKNVVIDEEEVILYKPLTRYSSAPVFNSITSSHQATPKDTEDPMVAADECLRRATSMLIAQNQDRTSDPSAFHSDFINFGCDKPVKPNDSLMRDTVAYTSLEASSSLSPGPSPFGASNSAGPPSLNAWVINREILGNDRTKNRSPATRHSLAPIEELVAASLNDLLINETDHGISSLPESLTTSYSSPNYLASVPSAPLLPDNAIWLNSNESNLSDYNNTGKINRSNNHLGEPQQNPFSNWTASLHPYDYTPGIIPGFVEGYQPVRQMTSSEWLRQYRENNNNKWYGPYHSALKADNFHGHQASWTGLFDQWGTHLASNSLIYGENPALVPSSPLLYGSDGHRRDIFLTGLQRPSPYGCGALNEPEPLLEYLKEKEWLLQQDPTFRGPTYMGS